jgi:steroid 5-alpha reductase family enzyme
LGVFAWLGIALAAIGILFEAIGDHQMAAFKSDPANHGKVMDRGLWRYTRHPNYFGDSCTWWGIYLVAAETSLGVWSIIGPLLLTWTLVKWSGAALLERRLRQSRPGYEEYLRRTSSFIPWPPAKSEPGTASVVLSGQVPKSVLLILISRAWELASFLPETT